MSLKQWLKKWRNLAEHYLLLKMKMQYQKPELKTYRKAKLTKSRAAENNQQNTLTKFHSLLKGKSRIPRVSLPKLVGALCID